MLLEDIFLKNLRTCGFKEKYRMVNFLLISAHSPDAEDGIHIFK